MIFITKNLYQKHLQTAFLASVMLVKSLFAESLQDQANLHHNRKQQPSEGVILAEFKDGEEKFASAGLTSKNGKKPNKDTLYEIGSITKVFTCILLAEAVREGKAEFADPVAKHLPKIKFKAESPFNKITLEELATHRSGMPRLPLNLKVGASPSNPYAHYDANKLINGLKLFKSEDLEKTNEFSYSNYGAGLLGFILEQIYDQPYRDILKEKVLIPLGMNNTDVQVRYKSLPNKIKSNLATGHNAGEPVDHWEIASLSGAGAMISSAQDLITFGKAHWASDIPKGLASSLHEATQKRFDSQALGWFIDNGALTHGGQTGGFKTNLIISPLEKYVQLELTNSTGEKMESSRAGDFSKLQGYWRGALDTGSRKLRLLFSISDKGTVVVYSLDQGRAAIKANKVHEDEGNVYFSFPSIEGEFEGDLKENKLIGGWKQGNKKPLTLTRTKDVPKFIEKNASNSADLSDITGYWSGYLGGKKGLFIYVSIEEADGAPHVALYSPDQHNGGIQVDSVSREGDELVLKASPINGSYNATISKNRKTLKGTFTQGQNIPLTLKWSENVPSRK